MKIAIPLAIMKNWTRRKRIALFTILACVLAGLCLIAPRFWWKVVNAKVSLNGKASGGDVFQSFGGRYLVTIPENGYINAYIIDRENNHTMRPSVSIANPNGYITLLGCAISKDVPIMIIDTMPGVKAPINPKLVLHQRTFEFTSDDLAHIRVVL